MPMYSPADLAMMSPTEAEVAREMMAAIEAGRDPTMDPDEQPTATTPPAEAPAPAPAPAADDTATGAQGEDTIVGQGDDATPPAAPAPEPAPAPAADATPKPTTPPAPVQYQVQADMAKLQEERTAIRKQMAEITQQWSDGDITPEEYQAKITPLQDKVDEIIGTMAVAQSLQAANVQTLERSQKETLDTIAAIGRQAGIDYGKPVISAQFNAIMDALDKDPAYAQSTFAELASQAHATVLAMHGKAAPPPAPTPAPAPAPTAADERRNVPPPPKTLRTMPSAEPANQGFEQGTIGDRIAAANAVDAEAQWERLTKAQQQALMRGQKI